MWTDLLSTDVDNIMIIWYFITEKQPVIENIYSIYDVA